MPHRIAVLSGDGIGPEVMSVCLDVLEAALGDKSALFSFEEAAVGGVGIDKCGKALPAETLSLCESSDAILFGSVGGPKWEHLPPDKQPERGALLPLRKHFDLFANMRPVKAYPELSHSCPLREEIMQDGVDIMVLRELTGGIYFGNPSGRDGEGQNERGFDTMEYHRYEIERIAQLALETASKRKQHVTSVDKANVLSSMVFWREVVIDKARVYNEEQKIAKKMKVELNHLYVDNAAMQIILAPHNFDVLLCGNLFGDIISDEASILGGSLGMLPSASLSSHKSGEGYFGLYEPAGGSAPEIAGKSVANPIAQILSGALLLAHSFNMTETASRIENAIHEAIRSGARTNDIANKKLFTKDKEETISTIEMGQEIKLKLT